MTRPQCRHLSAARPRFNPTPPPQLRAFLPRPGRRVPPPLSTAAAPSLRGTSPTAQPPLRRHGAGENGVIAVTPPTTRARFGRQRHAYHPRRRGDIKLYEKSPSFRARASDPGRGMPVRNMTKKKKKKRKRKRKNISEGFINARPAAAKKPLAKISKNYTRNTVRMSVSVDNSRDPYRILRTYKLNP